MADGLRRSQPTLTARQRLTPRPRNFKTAKYISLRHACLLELEECQQKQQKLLKELEESEIASTRDEEPPDHFLCPISMEIMRDPVMLSATGHTFDRSCILRWFAGNKLRCPMTNQSLTSTKLLPNLVLRSPIMEWCQQHDIVLEPLGDETTRRFHDLLSELHNSPQQGEVIHREVLCKIHELILSGEDKARAALVEANGIEALLNLLMVAHNDDRATLILSVLECLCNNEGIGMLLRAFNVVLAISRVLQQEDNMAAREQALHLLKQLWSNTGKVERNEPEVLMPHIVKCLQDPLRRSAGTATDLLSMLVWSNLAS